jgi:hypothetical protein
MNIIKWIDQDHNEDLHKLMTSQLYTAVLGSIIYIFFDWGYKVLIADDGLTEDILIRTLFLLVCIVFYISDFYYIDGSNPYRKWHFFLDFIFMACMFYSAKTLYVDASSLSNLPDIQLGGVRNSYILFLILYFVWDLREFRATFKEPARKIQRNYYWEVIIWEFITIISLLLHCKIADKNQWLLLAIIALATAWFAFISRRKSRHMSLHQWYKSL